MGKVNLCFIRHGTTKNNLEGRFCGRGDHHLSEEGIEEITQLAAQYSYPAVDWVYTSPAARCRQTGEIVFPGAPVTVVTDLQELDFGDFEGRLASELWSLPDYEDWAKQNLEFAFPGGEKMKSCLGRAVLAIDDIVSEAVEKGYTNVGVLTHSILLSLLLRNHLAPAPERGKLFCPNGMGFVIEADPEQWLKKRVLAFGGELPEGAPRPDMADSPYVKK